MSLYSGCTKVLEVADYGGTTPELIIRQLPAGSYAVRLAGSGGTASPTYSFLMQRMPNTVHVLSTRARTDAGVFRLTGEVYNNTSRWVGPVTVTARLYNSTGKLLTTRSARTLLSYVPAYGRVPFSIDGPPVAGFHHTTWSVSAPATSKALGTPTITPSTNTLDSAGQRVIIGTRQEPVLEDDHQLRRGRDAVRRAGKGAGREAIRPRREQLGSGKSTTYTDHLQRRRLHPTRTYVRGVVHR